MSDESAQFRNPNLPPFYDGELVVATHPATMNKTTGFKYGHVYHIWCEWKEWYNKHHRCWVRMWYVGVYEHIDLGCHYAPYLFSSIQLDFEEISFEEIKEHEDNLCAN